MEKALLKQLDLWHRDKEYDKIIAAILEIPEQDRDYDAVSHLARAMNNLDRYEDAVQQLLTIEKQGENDPLWHFRLGYAYYYLSEYEGAVREFEMASKLDPADQSALQFLDWSHSGAEKQKKRARKKTKTVQTASGQSKHNGTGKAPFEDFDFTGFWDDCDYALKEYVAEPPTDELVASIEEELGYKLPASYIAMMKLHNGGMPVNTCFPTEDETSWSEDHIAITGIMGIGREKPYALCGELGSKFMIEEWGYPDIGVVICDCPSAGHDVVMLDYRACGRDGEPEVIHVDQENDYKITFLAENFEAFIRGLVNEDVYDTSEEDKQEVLRKVAGGAFSPLLSELCARVTEVENIEGIIRAVCTRIVEEKGFFALHADELSTLMYDLQFWLYTKSYPSADRETYLEAYKSMIAFGGAFGTGGYAPGFITDWLDDRIRQGMITEKNGELSFADQAAGALLEKLNGFASAGKAFGASGLTSIAEKIRPFQLVEHDSGNISMILDVGTYKHEVFQTRADEGFEGNGYDWGSVAAVFLEEKMPHLADIVRFDPEGSMFCAYSGNREAMQHFAIGFKDACEDDAVFRNLFSRAELD